MLRGRLEFGEDGMSKTLETQFSIIGYIERLLTYARRDVMIYIDNEALDECVPKLLVNNCGESGDLHGS
jgi:hypothetical protein